MRKREWVPVHRHTNPLDGGALRRDPLPVIDEDGCAPCPADLPYIPPVPPGPDDTGDVCNTVIEDSNRIGESDMTQFAVSGELWYFEVEQTLHTAGAQITNLTLSSAGVSPSTIYNLLSLWTSGEIGVGAGSPPLPLRSGTFIVGTQAGGGPDVFHLRVDADYLGPGVTVDECFHIEMWKGGAPTVPPPLRTQWVYDEVPTPAPDGSEDTFVTSNPYIDGSLIDVMMNGAEVTDSITAFDGATGSFTFADPPPLGAELHATYQGR